MYYIVICIYVYIYTHTEIYRQREFCFDLNGVIPVWIILQLAFFFFFNLAMSLGDFSVSVGSNSF